MPMVTFSIFFALGCLLLQQQAALPHPAWHWLPLILLLVFLPGFRLAASAPVTRSMLIAILALCSGYMHAAQLARERLQDVLPASAQGQDRVITGVVAEMPRLHERGSSFAFDVDQTPSGAAHVPSHILLSTYDNPDHPPLRVHAGEHWKLTVRLKQPHGTYNRHAFDFEAWMLERNLRAQGYVTNSDSNTLLGQNRNFYHHIELLREKIRERFLMHADTQQYAGVLTALAIGDQSIMPPSQWTIFTRTGTNHLMSISGLHITLLAGFIFFMVNAAWRRFPYLALMLPAHKAAALAALFTALVYALLSGFGIPAQRTVFMLGTMTASLLMSRNVYPSQLLALALLVVTIFDPWCVIAPGFWLSFAAVALIFYVTANRLGKRHWLAEYGLIQMAMNIGLIPLLLGLFQQVSLVSPIANAIAIPVVSFIVVPLAIFSAIFSLDWTLFPAHWAMQCVMGILQWLSDLPEAVWMQHAPPSWSVGTGILGVAWLFLPRGFPGKPAAAILLLPMFLLHPETPQSGEARLTVFDVGQGLAVAVQTRNHTLLYDTGPQFNNTSDSGNRILVPALRGMGISRLDTLILTHNDADHTGGALSLLQTIPAELLLSSLPPDSPILEKMKGHNLPCLAGQHWVWDQVNFDILHPDLEAYADPSVKNNDLGCVLRINTGSKVILLTADIERKSEKRLLSRSPEMLHADLVVVPHHGSKTSSTPEFVQMIHPVYAAITAGYRNRFGHPRPDIVQRYADQGSEIFRTDMDGAIFADMDAQQISMDRLRISRPRYWLHKPE